MALRTRLVILTLVLLAGGLLLVDVVTVAALRSYLLQRVDQQLAGAEPVASQQFSESSEDAHKPPGSYGTRPVPTGYDVTAARIDEDGQPITVLSNQLTRGDTLFGELPDSVLASARTGQRVLFETTVDGVRYRGLAVPLQGSDDVLVLLSSLASLQDTLVRLGVVEGVVTGAILAVGGGLSWWFVRVGLRPLRDMADTADAIAVGEVDRRIPDGGGAEVTRLGHALNAAFDARQESEDRLRTFVADASHELRTPLTSIRGYAELLRSGAVSTPGDVHQAVQRIEGEASRMGVLVDDLLALARMDQGRPLQLGDVELTVLAAEAVADARAVEADRPVHLQAPEPVPVQGDEHRLRQVFANLLANVREHTPPGTPVTVSVHPGLNRAVIEVVDEGPGIAPEQAERVFDRFWRADPAHGHKPGTSTGGAGLGLSIVASIAAAHHRTARVQPDAAGAHLVVELPLRQPTGAPAGDDATP